MPKLKTESYSASAGDRTWLGSLHGLDSAQTVTIDPTDFAAKTKARVIPSGTPLALKAKKTVPYNAAATDDAGKLVGFLLTDQPADRGKVAAPMLDHGRIKIGRLPETFVVPASGNDLTTCTYVPKED